MIIFKHALKRSLAQHINILIIFVLPLGVIFVPHQSLYLYGMLSLYSAFLLCKPIVEERYNRTLTRILSTPTTYFAYLCSHLLAYILILTIQSVIFIIGYYIYWKDININYLLLIALYITFNMMAIAFCLFWNSIFKSYNIAFALFSGAASVLSLFSGITMPLSIIPEEIRKFIIILPTYWLPYGLNALYNNISSDVFISIVILLVYSGILLLVGSRRRY